MWRDLQKVVTGLNLAEGTSIREPYALYSLLAHEILRVFGDRITTERDF